jgi:hypothetical protein
MTLRNYAGALLALAGFSAACAGKSLAETDVEEPPLTSLPPIAEKDLALVFAKTGEPVAAATTQLGSEQLLRVEWYEAVTTAFRGSSAERALEDNNTREEWRNVSTRVEPCAPLGVAPFQAADSLCWPELRLVLQPIKASVTFDRKTVTDYADDRGIHLLYDVPGDGVLSRAELAEANALKAKVTAAVRAGTWGPSSGEPLTPAEKARFVALRDRVARSFLGATVALRDKGLAPKAFEGLGPRPELGAPASAAAFAKAYVAYLGRYARGAAIKQVAAFSLEGGFRFRSTTPDWRGAFVSLRPVDGKLVPEPLGVVSPVSGEELIAAPSKAPDLEIQATGKYAFDVDGQLRSSAPYFGEPPSSFPTLAELQGITFAPRVETFLPELRGQFVPPSVGSPAFYAVAARVSDRTKVLVTNSSCATCHLLQQDRVLAPGGEDVDSSNVHNLSFFSTSDVRYDDKPANGDRGFSTSPRVVKDVAFDLGWIAELERRSGGVQDR